MKRVVIFLGIALVCAAIGWAAYQAALPPAPPLSKYVPAGALLYLEAQDFSSLLTDWNSSTQKKAMGRDQQLRSLLPVAPVSSPQGSERSICSRCRISSEHEFPLASGRNPQRAGSL